MPISIVILSSHSLFAEGVASRLRQYPQRVNVQFVDPQQPDYIDQIKTIRPAAVVVDAADTDNSQCCLLCDLLIASLNVTIIRLKVHRKDVQIIASAQRPFNEVKDIIDLLEQSPRMLGL